MTKVLEYSFLALGGTSFFTVAYVGFAAANGVPAHEIPVLGGLFPAPPAEGEEPDAAASGDEPGLEPRSASVPTAEDELASGDHALLATLGVVSAFTLESPHNAAELQVLADELRDAKLRYEQRGTALQAREAEAGDRLETARIQLAEVQAMRAELDQLLDDLLAREAALAARALEQSTADRASYTDMAQLFEEGEVDEIAQRLVQFPPDEAARVLRALDPARAAELLNGITDPERWKAYSEAYSKQPK